MSRFISVLSVQGLSPTGSCCGYTEIAGRA